MFASELASRAFPGYVRLVLMAALQGVGDAEGSPPPGSALGGRWDETFLRGIPTDRLSASDVAELLRTLAGGLPLPEGHSAPALRVASKLLLGSPRALAALAKSSVTTFVTADETVTTSATAGTGSSGSADESVMAEADGGVWTEFVALCLAALSGASGRSSNLASELKPLLELLRGLVSACGGELMDRVWYLLSELIGPAAAAAPTLKVRLLLEEELGQLPWHCVRVQSRDAEFTSALAALQPVLPVVGSLVVGRLDWGPYFEAVSEGTLEGSTLGPLLRSALEAHLSVSGALNSRAHFLIFGEVRGAADAAGEDDTTRAVDTRALRATHDAAWAKLPAISFARALDGGVLLRALLRAKGMSEPTERVLQAVRLLGRLATQLGTVEAAVVAVQESRALLFVALTPAPAAAAAATLSGLGGAKGWHLSANAHLEIVSRVIVPLALSGTSERAVANGKNLTAESVLVQALVSCAFPSPALMAAEGALPFARGAPSEVPGPWDASPPRPPPSQPGGALNIHDGGAAERAERWLALVGKCAAFVTQGIAGGSATLALGVLRVVGSLRNERVATALMEAALQAFLSHKAIESLAEASTAGSLLAEPLAALQDKPLAADRLVLACVEGRAPLAFRLLMAHQAQLLPSLEAVRWLPLAIASVRAAARLSPPASRDFDVLPAWFAAVELILSDEWLVEYSAAQQATLAIAKHVHAAARLGDGGGGGLSAALFDTRSDASAGQSGGGGASAGLKLAARVLLAILSKATHDKSAGLHGGPSRPLVLLDGPAEARAHASALVKAGHSADAQFRSVPRAFFTALEAMLARPCTLAEWRAHVLATLFPMAVYLPRV